MKRFLKIIPLLCLACSIAVISSACNLDGHGKIANAYAKQYHIDKSEVNFTCYKEFGGAHIVMFEGMYPQALSQEIVDGVVFHHSEVKTFHVYKSGKFYSLQEAFKQGLVTHSNLLSLRDEYCPIVDGDSDAEYRLTVYDPDGVLEEPLQETYRAGERVTVKTAIIADLGISAYLDGVSLGSATWLTDYNEFYFVMPAHHAELTFTFSGGM